MHLVRRVALLFFDLGMRALDLVLAGGALALMAPWLALCAVVARRQRGRCFDRAWLLGRYRAPFARLRFACDLPGRSLAVLLNVLRGDLSLVGPRALTPAELQAMPADATVRFEVRPGLVSLHALRRRSGIDHEPEHESDRRLVYDTSFGSQIGLLSRSIPVALLGGTSSTPPPPFLDFFGVPIINTTMDEAIDWIVAASAGEQAARLAFVNPACLNIAHHDEAYRRALLSSARVLPDGIGIHIGCRILGTPLRANVNGTDLFPLLCDRVAGTEHSIFLLGARPGVAEAVADAMRKLHPALPIAGTHDGYFDENEAPQVIEQINTSGARILLVAFGVPAQDLWLARHHDELAPPVRMGVGGLFDFYSGRIPRAPQWLRELGLEWVWRMAQEPGRMWRRYVIGNPLFLLRVLRQARGGPRPRE